MSDVQVEIRALTLTFVTVLINLCLLPYFVYWFSAQAKSIKRWVENKNKPSHLKKYRLIAIFSVLINSHRAFTYLVNKNFLENLNLRDCRLRCDNQFKTE